MKRFLLILVSIFLTINIVGAGVVQFHHHHHGDASICLCINLDHVDEYHTGDGDCCANDCSDSANSNNDYHHLHRLDDFNVEKVAPKHIQIVDFELLGVLVNDLIYSLTAEPLTTCYFIDREVDVHDICDSDAATRRGPPQC